MTENKREFKRGVSPSFLIPLPLAGEGVHPEGTKGIG
jgi:hypothetical protein